MPIKGSFLLSVAACMLTGIYTQVLGQPSWSGSAHYTLKKLSEGVYAAIHNDDGGLAICNAGIIDLGDKTVVIDPFMTPGAARDLKNDAESLTGRTVSIVVNLDSHEDHTRGNQVFVPGAVVIGTSYTRQVIESGFYTQLEHEKKSAPAALEHLQQLIRLASGEEKQSLEEGYLYNKALAESVNELVMTPPDVIIRDTLVIHGSLRSMIIVPTGNGHTPGDMIVWLPAEQIVFMGDQLFVERHPYLGDGNPENLEKTLYKVLALDPRIAVPGHGPVGNASSVQVLIGYLDDLQKLVGHMIEKAGNKNSTLSIPVPDAYKNWGLRSFYPGNLGFLYDLLSRQGNQ
jgi:glyoxylase-like metal-dependent hydrolase (beta-lactamase superfamily II)